MRSASMMAARHYKARRLAHAGRRKTFVDLVFEEAGRRGRRHELAVHLGGDPAVLDQLSVAEFDFQHLSLRVVADRSDLARVDAFALHALVSLLSWILRAEALGTTC